MQTQTQPWTGYEVAKQTALPIKPNHPFWMMHHPMTCWELIHFADVDKYYWMPNFRKLYDMPGCNAVRMVKNGRGADSTMARVQMMDNGFEILDLEFGYQQRFSSRYGGFVYREIWEKPKIIGNRVIWNFDDIAFNDWRKQLMDDGVLQQPDPDVIDIFIERQERRISRNAQRGHIPHVAKEIEKSEHLLLMMKLAKDELYKIKDDHIDEKPTIKRGRKKKNATE